MIGVFVNNTVSANQIFVCGAESYRFFFRVIFTENLRYRHHLIHEVLVDRELQRVFETKRCAMITITVGAFKLSFDTDSLFRAFIHLCFNTFSACRIPTAHYNNRCSALTIEILHA